MGRKPKPSPLATVTRIPTQRRRGRPYKNLVNAVAQAASERDVLVLLRKRIASALDGDDLQLAAFAALVRQFQQVDGKIRALDLAAAAAAEDDEGDADVDHDDAAGWDPSSL